MRNNKWFYIDAFRGQRQRCRENKGVASTLLTKKQQLKKEGARRFSYEEKQSVIFTYFTTLS